MYFGSHVSISKGYLEAAKYAYKIGAKSFQYFPKNPRSLTIKKFDEKDANKCAEFSKEHNLLSIAHTPYPTNIAVEDEDKQLIMVHSLLNDLEIAEACGSVGIIVHFGKYKGSDPLVGYKNIIQVLNQVNENWNGNTLILLENQASTMGTSFEEMVQIRNMVEEPEKIGFCFDTCHGFASGLWSDSWSQVLEKGIKLDYFSHLKAIHINDSKYESGSFRDRHENVGKGFIGEKRFIDFLQTSQFKGLPIVLETPQSKEYTHQDEINMLNNLIRN